MRLLGLGKNECTDYAVTDHKSLNRPARNIEAAKCFTSVRPGEFLSSIVLCTIKCLQARHKYPESTIIVRCEDKRSDRALYIIPYAVPDSRIAHTVTDVEEWHQHIFYIASRLHIPTVAASLLDSEDQTGGGDERRGQIESRKLCDRDVVLLSTRKKPLAQTLTSLQTASGRWPSILVSREVGNRTRGKDEKTVKY
ncbi:hypothetical protein F2P81_019438 [Scophthalmus maximus]|uniref:Uncharacterized protein n=1 Tax=Scophthalmus maximus TaxID=52904 RepID=A0A6A4SB89_SCOMX|nr:hypothetical protein F2P81_019438 [Scophthalmus maximus]